jgi:hypothetical protein
MENERMKTHDANEQSRMIYVNNAWSMVTETTLKNFKVTLGRKLLCSKGLTHSRELHCNL